MKVHLKYFAALREALGVDAETLDTTSGTVGELRAELRARGGAWAERLGEGRNVRIALNHTMVPPATPLVDGAEVAFFPPVTGG